MKLTTAFLLLILMGDAAMAQSAFHYIRIGDIDGFGFRDTTGMVRPYGAIGPGPADTNGNGRLERGEFLPDLDGGGSLWWGGNDEFDNREPSEIADRNHRCAGCKNVGTGTRGAIWTDIALSTASDATPWPDTDGPATPNNAVFVFDFTVGKNAIAAGTRIFFNILFGDYDVYPAEIRVTFSGGRQEILRIPNRREEGLDGAIQAKTAFFGFDRVFTKRTDGDWQGYVKIVFDAPEEPWTAFDYVELSIRAEVTRFFGPRIPAPAPS